MSYIKIGALYSQDNSCEFVLWAPFASSVDVKFVYPEQYIIAMDRDVKGYWRKTVNGISPGCRYFYLVDGTTQRPDPASAYQPEGVHGPSEVIDHAAFTWTDSKRKIPAPDRMIFYEIHTGTFTPQGTFEAIIPVLPELKDLGITALELMPVAQFPGDRNWGYDGTYPYAVQNSYGGPDGLKRLCDACHGTGLVLFLDVVYNHLGPEGNYLSAYGPYFTGKYRSAWGEAVNFDGEYSDGVRNYFIRNCLYWLENYHIDGLRLDAVHGIYDMGAKHILEEMADAVKSFGECRGGKYFLVAESDLNDSRIVKGRRSGGYGADAQWSDDFHHSVHTLLTGESTGYYMDFGELSHLATALTDGFVYTGQYSSYRKRNHGNPSKDIDGKRIVVSIQNHDQVGNRMNGERITELAGFEAHKLAAGTMMISPYIPLLFMGEEYAETAPFLYFINHGDPELADAVRKGRKREFESFAWGQEPPDPRSAETFNRSKLRRNYGDDTAHRAMFHYYRELISFRRDISALRNLSRKNLEVESDGDGHVLIVRRKYRESGITAVMNFSAERNSCVTGAKGVCMEKIFDSADAKWHGPGTSGLAVIKGRRSIDLMPFNFLIYAFQRTA